MFYNPTCNHFHKQRIVTTGLLPDAALPSTTNNESNNDTSSFIIPRYSTDGHTDNVQLNVRDSTMKQREKLINSAHDNENQTSIDLFMSRQRARAGFDNSKSSSLIIENSYDKSQEINDDIGSNVEENIDGQILTDSDNINLMETNDIRLQQEQLTKRFNQMTMSKLDVMEIDLYHLLKSSNAPLILFDRIINWLQRHDSTIKQYSSFDLMTRPRLLDDLNAKLYDKEVLMKPRLCRTNLSSGRSTNVVVFSVKEMIL